MNTILAPVTLQSVVSRVAVPLQSVQSRVEVFDRIFLVFLALGTLVGIVVIAYTLYNAYKYRDTGEEQRKDKDRPSLGELPTGGGGGKKLFVSFLFSAIIVISLIVWTFGMLMYVEAGPDNQPGEDAVEIEVHGFAFGWHFDYVTEDGQTIRSTGEMVLPEDTTVWLSVTSDDVWHALGIPEQRVKADAIPGEYDETWFHTDELEDGESANYTAECFELCGPGHSGMEADVRIVPQDEYDQWYADLEENAEPQNQSDGNGDTDNETDESEDDGGGH